MPATGAPPAADVPARAGAEAVAFGVLGSSRAQVGESPLWSPGEQAWWWVDIEGRRLHRHRHGADSGDAWPMPERLACIAPHARGGLVAAMESGVFHVRPEGEGSGGLSVVRLATASHPKPGMRFNDGRCDRAGRFWVTTMVRDMALADASGSLHRFDHRGLSAPLVTGLVTGNGLAFSPDGATLYLSDSHPSVRRVWRFAVDADGGLSDRRLHVDMTVHPGRPDGAAVDAAGGYWTAANDAGMLLRFDARGRLDRALRLPVSKPSMCAFGGPALDVLAVTSIVPPSPRPGFDAALDGAVLLLRPGVRGIAETPFAPSNPAREETRP